MVRAPAMLSLGKAGWVGTCTTSSACLRSATVRPSPSGPSIKAHFWFRAATSRIREAHCRGECAGLDSASWMSWRSPSVSSPSTADRASTSAGLALKPTSSRFDAVAATTRVKPLVASSRVLKTLARLSTSEAPPARSSATSPRWSAKGWTRRISERPKLSMDCATAPRLACTRGRTRTTDGAPASIAAAASASALFIAGTASWLTVGLARTWNQPVVSGSTQRHRRASGSPSAHSSSATPPFLKPKRRKCSGPRPQALQSRAWLMALWPTTSTLAPLSGPEQNHGRSPGLS
mmetsp:Transcript_21907/g.49529  ORF Transcript_21907/g.49529 Transcript_21907/m.49529 type:complete len:292 (-) Transcript_21907:302-1177(-)